VLIFVVTELEITTIDLTETSASTENIINKVLDVLLTIVTALERYEGGSLRLVNDYVVFTSTELVI
jgi:hypothetical protein